MSKRFTASEMSEKWQRNTSAATGDYIKGVQKVTEAPGAKAVKKQAKLKENFNKAVDSGKWAERTGAVGLEEWRDETVTKGGQNFATGVSLGRKKRESFDEQFATFLDTHVQAMDQMADDTEAQREQKMIENVRRMRKFRAKRVRR